MIRWATVTAASPFRVAFDGELESPATYLKPKNGTITVGDRVAFLVLGGQYVCLGVYIK